MKYFSLILVWLFCITSLNSIPFKNETNDWDITFNSPELKNKELKHQETIEVTPGKSIVIQYSHTDSNGTTFANTFTLIIDPATASIEFKFVNPDLDNAPTFIQTTIPLPIQFTNKTIPTTIMLQSLGKNIDFLKTATLQKTIQSAAIQTPWTLNFPITFYPTYDKDYKPTGTQQTKQFSYAFTKDPTKDIVIHKEDSISITYNLKCQPGKKGDFSCKGIIPPDPNKTDSSWQNISVSLVQKGETT